MEKILRPYQTEAISNIHAAVDRGVKTMALILPTGCGKTLTCVRAIQPYGRKLWIASTIELIEQSAIALLDELEIMPYDTLIDVLGNMGGLIELIKAYDKGFRDPHVRLIAENIGVIKAEMFDINKPIVISSAQTLHRRLEQIPPNWFDVVIADECDLFSSVSFKKSLLHLNSRVRIGLTATFYRLDNLPLEDIFEEIVYEYPIDRAISEGYLTKPEAIVVKTSADLDGVHTMAGEFNQKELTEVVNTAARNFQIVNKYIEYGQGRQFIAFCCNVEHTIDLCQAFKDKGINCEYVVGDKTLTTDRRGIIERFKGGEITGLTNALVLTVGFDFPDIGCCILAAPTKSRRKFIQSLGRGLRLKSDKFVAKWAQDCIILDIVDSTTRHRLINTKELDKDLPIEKKVYISDRERQLLLDVKAKREASFTNNREKDERVDLLQLPKITMIDSVNGQREATEKQLAFIAKFGYDIVNENYTMKMVNEILNSQSASAAQIWKLKQIGYDVSNGVTVPEAAKAFSDYTKKQEKEKLKSQTPSKLFKDL